MPSEWSVSPSPSLVVGRACYERSLRISSCRHRGSAVSNTLWKRSIPSVSWLYPETSRRPVFSGLYDAEMAMMIWLLKPVHRIQLFRSASIYHARSVRSSASYSPEAIKPSMSCFTLLQHLVALSSPERSMRRLQWSSSSSNERTICSSCFQSVGTISQEEHQVVALPCLRLRSL